MNRLLVLRDIQALGAVEFANALLRQSMFQHGILKKLRFRRPEINAVFSSMILPPIVSVSTVCSDSSAISNARYSFGSHDIASCKAWAVDSRAALSSSFERLAVDGLKWEGRLGNNLNLPLNQVCEHSLHAIMCLDLLLAMVDEECGLGENGGSPHTALTISSAGIVERDIDLRGMLEDSIIPDIESLTKEKFGACPAVSVHAIDSSSGMVPFPSIGAGVPSLLSYVMVELLKNGLEAVLVRYGALDLEDAEMDGALLDFTLVRREGPGYQLGELIIRDRGCGIAHHRELHESNHRSNASAKEVTGGPINHLQHPSCFDAFYSTSSSRSREPSYHYSRMFGVPYSGAGMGLLKSKVFLDFHEAKIFVESNEMVDGGGTTVRIVFNPPDSSTVS